MQQRMKKVENLSVSRGFLCHITLRALHSPCVPVLFCTFSHLFPFLLRTVFFFQDILLRVDLSVRSHLVPRDTQLNLAFLGKTGNLLTHEMYSVQGCLQVRLESDTQMMASSFPVSRFRFHLDLFSYSFSPCTIKMVV